MLNSFFNLAANFELSQFLKKTNKFRMQIKNVFGLKFAHYESCLKMKNVVLSQLPFNLLQITRNVSSLP